VRPEGLINIEVEQELIGTVLVNNPAYSDAPVDPADFSLPLHGEIWRTIGEAIEAGRPANAHTVKQPFEGRAEFVRLGGGDYLGRLAANSSSFTSVAAYAELIRDLAARRRIVEALEGIRSEAHRFDGSTALDVVADATGRLEGAVGAKVDSSAVEMPDAVDETMAELERAWIGEPTGVKTGLKDVDGIFEGFEPGGLYILAGRPGMGKTGVALAIAENVAASRRVLFHSLEMPKEQLVARLVASSCGIAYRRLRHRLDPEEMRIAAEAGVAMRNMALTIDDRSAITVSHLRASIRRAQMKGPVGLVVVDYLQILQPDGVYRGNKVAEITSISNALKVTARQCEVPILALAQLSRQLESRDDKRPFMSDLRESGAIEQDADAIMLLYRPEYYSRQRAEADPNDAEAQAQVRMDANKLEIDVAKQRMGAPGRVTVWFDAGTNRVRNWGGNVL
jgi:replicative DNA helicase